MIAKPGRVFVVTATLAFCWFSLFSWRYQSNGEGVRDIDPRLEIALKNNQRLQATITSLLHEVEVLKKTSAVTSGNSETSLNDPASLLRGQQRADSSSSDSSSSDSSSSDGLADVEKQNAVKGAFLHSWRNYEEHAFGNDEFHPLSRRGSNWGGGHGVGVTIADAMSTMLVMGLDAEFQKCLDWCRDHLNFNQHIQVSRFETIIRVLGGLISAYELSGHQHKVLLDRAIDLADRLSGHGNRASNGIPYRTSSLASSSSSGGYTNLAELGSEQMELRTLSRLTGNMVYAQATNKVINTLDSVYPTNGLPPINVNADGSGQGIWAGGASSMGASGDSFFEYLLKLWVMSGKRDKQTQRMFLMTLHGILNEMVQKAGNLTYLADVSGGQALHNFGHLACFSGGMLGLAAKTSVMGDDDTLRRKSLRVAEELANTCHDFYIKAPLGIGPEAVYFSGNGYSATAHYYILRPEVVESYFYLWRITKKQIYRDYAWEAFKAFEKWCKVEHGFAAIDDVYRKPPPLSDKMESFWLAETLKYLYLIFSADDLVDLDKWVFNTEAHPMMIHKEGVDGPVTWST